jgi:hypothetical protein
MELDPKMDVAKAGVSLVDNAEEEIPAEAPRTGPVKVRAVAGVADGTARGRRAAAEKKD